MTLNTRKIYLLAAPMLFFVACASVPPPVAPLTEAQSSVQRAQAADLRGEAAQTQRAAEQSLEAAQIAMNAKKYAEAEQWAQRAQALSRLALTTGRLAQARESAESRAARNADLRRELLIKSGSK